MRPAILLVLLLMIAPASAAWIDRGQTEPGPRDPSDRMWPDAARSSSGGRVVFNAYASEYVSGANPGLARPGAEAALVPTLVRWEATLGLWNDCNGDDYVGHEAGLLAYPPALLDAAGAAACPEGGLHRVDGLVVELRPIGMLDPCAYEPADVRRSACGGIAGFSPNPTVLYANGTYVWGDLLNRYRYDGCSTWPLPPGTTARTGALVAYADCRLDGQVVRSANYVDPDGSLGIRFEGPPQRSDSRLNQDLPAHPYSNPYTGKTGLLEYDSDEPAFTVWDCASGEPAPAPAPGDPTASWIDAADAAVDGATSGCEGTRTGPVDVVGQALDLEQTWGATPASSYASRAANDLVLRFVDGAASSDRIASSSTLDAALGSARWTSSTAWFMTQAPVDRRHLSLRDDLDWTFYARVNLSAIGLDAAALPAGGATFRYGGEVCPDAWTWPAPGGVWGAWDCDPARWWTSWIGDDPMPRYARGEPLGQRVGDPYHLRDWDCQDSRMLRSSLVPAPDAPLRPSCGGS